MTPDKSMRLGFLLTATDQMSKVLDDISQKTLPTFDKKLAKVGRDAMRIGGHLEATGERMFGFAFNTVKAATEYIDASIKTAQKVGMGVQEWQKLAYAADRAGVSNEQLASGMARFNKTITEAASGSGEAAGLFQKMGISLKDAAGNLRAPEEIFKDVAQRFSTLEDGAAKTAASMVMFGKSGSNFLPLLNGGAEGLDEMAKRVVQLGLVTEGIGAEKFNDTLEDVDSALLGLKVTMATALVPVLTKLAEIVISIITGYTAWAAQHPGLSKVIGVVVLSLGALLVAVGSASIAFGAMSYSILKVRAAFKGIKTAITGVQSAMLFMKAVITGTNSAWAKALLSQRQYAVAMKLHAVWQKIAAAAQWLFNASLYGCPIVWIIAAIMAVIAIVVLLVKNWDKVAAFFKGLWERVKGIFVAAWQGIKNFFAATWEWIKSFFAKWGIVILAVIAPFIGIPLLIIKHWDAIKAWFMSLGDWFSGLAASFYEWGSNLIQGLIDGIVEKVTAVWETIKNIGKSIGDTFCSILGINSPSRLFMEYGMNITAGLTSGIAKGEGAVGGASEGLAMQTVQGVNRSIQSGAVNTSSVMNNMGGASLNYAPSITISGDASTGSSTEDFAKMLRRHKDEIIEIMQRFSEYKARVAFV